MNKKFKVYALVWAIFLVAFNVVAFVTPNEIAGVSKFDGAFWIGYLFITVAFVGQLVCAYFAFQADSRQKMFYHISLISVSYTGLMFMLVFGVAVMAIPKLPAWVGIIVCFLVLAFTAIAVAKAAVAVDIVEQIDEKVKGQTFFIKSLTVDAKTLLSRAGSDEVQAECKKVFEAVRYSDPMSSNALVSVEAQIAAKFATLSDAVAKENIGSVRVAANELVILLQDRNSKCKLLK